MEDIKGLDEVEVNYIHLYSEIDSINKEVIELGPNLTNQKNTICRFITTLIEVDTTIINNDKNGIRIKSAQSICNTIKNITYEEEVYAFQFVVEYLNKYCNATEWVGIKKPPTESNVKYWLDDTIESELFSQFRDINLLNEDNSLMRKVSILLLFANYLSMDGLVNKCCYLIAYAISGKTPDQIKKLMDF